MEKERNKHKRKQNKKLVRLYHKQLLDEVFVISRIIVLLYIERKKMEVMFLLLH